jgi:diguanylate cyclase (GGDEF)-like protein
VSPLPAPAATVATSAAAAATAIAAATAAAVIAIAALVVCLLRLRHQRDQARWQALHDPLTGAPNRRAFTTALHRLLAAGQPVAVAVAMIDIDRFKHINDRYGHQAGDQVLAELAARLVRLPAPVLLAARLGGDEFALLIAGGLNHAQHAARAAWAAIAHPPVPIADGQPIRLTASIGVAARHHPGITAAQLLHHADLAMQHAKTGSGGVRAHAPDQPVTARPTHRRRDRRH